MIFTYFHAAEADNIYYFHRLKIDKNLLEIIKIEKKFIIYVLKLHKEIIVHQNRQYKARKYDTHYEYYDWQPNICH